MKKIVGCLKDAVSGKPVSSANVKLVSADGDVIDSGSSNSSGNFEIFTDTFSDGAMVFIAKNGYQKILVEPVLFETCYELAMQRGNSLTIMGSKMTPSMSMLIIAALIVGGYFLTESSAKGRGGVAGIGSIDYTPFILLAVLGAGGYFVYQKFFGSSTGAQAAAANTSAITQTNASAIQQAQAANAATGQTTTLSATQISSNANTIFSLGTSGNPVSDDDQYQIQNIVIECNNNADWLALVAAFGTKQVETGTGQINADDLVTFLTGVLTNPQYVTTVNQFFSDTGINATIGQ